MSRRTFLKGVAAGAVGGLAVAAYGEQGAGQIVVERSELRIPGWKADGFKVAFLADFHAIDAVRCHRAREAVRLAAAEKPDAILIGGDFTSRSTPWAIDLLSQSVSDLPPGVPTFGVLGNHDYATADPELVAETLGRNGVRMLLNETAFVDEVAIVGVDDMLFGRGSWACAAGHSGPPSVLALLHEPDFVSDAPTNVLLQLSGHSHGGQMCLPMGIPLRLPIGGRQFYRGFYPNAPRPLYVTRGVGTTGIDYRLWCPPEVSILTLRAA